MRTTIASKLLGTARRDPQQRSRGEKGGGVGGGGREQRLELQACALCGAEWRCLWCGLLIHRPPIIFQPRRGRLRCLLMPCRCVWPVCLEALLTSSVSHAATP